LPGGPAGPRAALGFGAAVAQQGLAHAAIDLSDGLSGDLLAVCQESGVAAWLEGETMPIDPGAAMPARERGVDP
jgi:thiamine-monophosphate kinase